MGWSTPQEKACSATSAMTTGIGPPCCCAISIKTNRDEQPSLREWQRSIVQGGGRQVDRGIPGCLLHASADASHPARGPDPVPKHGHGQRYDQRQQDGSDQRPGGDVKGLVLLQ